MIRRFRAALKLGVVWALPWSLTIGALQAIGIYVEGLPLSASLLRAVLFGAINGVIGGAFFGFVIGSAFGMILSVVERNRGLASLSLLRFSMWGGLAGGLLTGTVALLPMSQLRPIAIPLVIAASALLGALSAAGSLALARRGAEEQTSVDADLPRASSEPDPIAETMDLPDTLLSGMKRTQSRQERK